jgi:hypothetical protein
MGCRTAAGLDPKLFSRTFQLPNVLAGPAYRIRSGNSRAPWPERVCENIPIVLCGNKIDVTVWVVILSSRLDIFNSTTGIESGAQQRDLPSQDYKISAKSNYTISTKEMSHRVFGHFWAKSLQIKCRYEHLPIPWRYALFNPYNSYLILSE